MIFRSKHQFGRPLSNSPLEGRGLNGSKKWYGEKAFNPGKTGNSIVQRERAQTQRLQARTRACVSAGVRCGTALWWNSTKICLKGARSAALTAFSRSYSAPSRSSFNKSTCGTPRRCSKPAAERFHLVAARLKVAHVVMVVKDRAALVGEALVEGECSSCAAMAA